MFWVWLPSSTLVRYLKRKTSCAILSLCCGNPTLVINQDQDEQLPIVQGLSSNAMLLHYCVLLGWHCIQDLSADQSYFVPLGKPTLPHTGSSMINWDLFPRWSASIWDWGSSLRIIAASITQQSILFSKNDSNKCNFNPYYLCWSQHQLTGTTILPLYYIAWQRVKRKLRTFIFRDFHRFQK